jgi:addiction module RelE/StbE family toxin
MSSYNIEITEPAERDLFEIEYYISEELKEPDIAKKVIERISKVIFDLEEMPHRYSLVSDKRLATQGIRKLIVENYIVFYYISEECTTVTIIRILYSRRHWVNLL